MTSTSSNRSRLLRTLAPCAVLLVALTLTAYRFGTHAAWHLDDFPNIVQRPAVQTTVLSLDNLSLAAREGDLKARPLTNLTFAIDWWRSSPSTEESQRAHAFVSTNLAIHTLTALLLLLLLWRITGTAFAAFAGAAWWSVQPIHMTAVAYVSQRFTSLSGMLILAAVTGWLYARALSPPWPRRMLLGFSLLAAILAPLAKEPGILVVPLLLLTEYTLCRTSGPLLDHWRDKVILAVAALAAGALLTDLLVHGPIRVWLDGIYAERYAFGLGEQLLTQARAMAFYVSLLLWPDPDRFSLLHDFEVSRTLMSPPSTLLSWAGVAAWGAMGIHAIRKTKTTLAFGMLWVLVAASMENSILPIEPIYEYRLYVPSIGIAILIAAALAGIQQRRCQFAKTTLAAFAIGIALLINWSRAPIFGSSIAVAEEMYRHAPTNPLAAIAVGTILLHEHRPHEAEPVFRRLAELPQLRGEPRHRHEALNGLGEALFDMGRFQDADTAYSKAIALAPRISNYRWNRALSLEKTGNCQAARLEWQTFLALSTDSRDKNEVMAHLNEVHQGNGACARVAAPEI